MNTMRRFGLVTFLVCSSSLAMTYQSSTKQGSIEAVIHSTKREIKQLKHDCRFITKTLRRIETENKRLKSDNQALIKEVRALQIKDAEIEKIIKKSGSKNRDFLSADQECKHVECRNKYGCELSSSFGAIQKAAFSAHLSRDLARVTLEIPIVFDQVITNIGNNYSLHTGDFSCFHPGVYVFYVKIMANSPFNAVETHLMKNGIIMARTYSNVTNSLGNSGNMAVTQLDKGDRVWVRLGYVDDLYGIDDDLYGIDEEYTSFSGFLLY